MIRFAPEASEDDKQVALHLFVDKCNTVNFPIPWGYVYRTISPDGRTYIGKHKLYLNEDWEHYLGSGTKLKELLRRYDANQFVKELVCFGYSSDDVREKEISSIREELRVKGEDNVLNMRIIVFDSSNHSKLLFEEKYHKIETQYSKKIAILHNEGMTEKSIWRKIHKDDPSIGRKILHEFFVNHGYSAAHSEVVNIVNHCRYCGKPITISGYRYNEKKLLKKHVYCSDDCKQKFLKNVKIIDYPIIMRMIRSGYTISEVAKEFHAGTKEIRKILDIIGIAVESKRGPKTFKGRQKNSKRNMHIRWHVNRNIVSHNCIFCNSDSD